MVASAISLEEGENLIEIFHRSSSLLSPVCFPLQSHLQVQVYPSTSRADVPTFMTMALVNTISAFA